ncbi:MAG: hypothetical protein Q4B67_05985 [Eubacteriales bacterium]|nr:hypothetical protein [Eubacteriales bacterium]
MIKNTIESIKTNIKGLSFKEALDYIWTYYKLPITGIVLGVIFIVSIASTVITNAMLDPVLRLGVENSICISEDALITEKLGLTFPDSKGNNAPVIMSVNDVNDDTAYGPVQLMAYLSANELDAIICTEPMKDYLIGVFEEENNASFNDISSSQLGIELAPVFGSIYYVYLKDSDHVAAAEKFLTIICE